MAKYTTVLFDIDDTLLDFAIAYEFALTELLTKRNLPANRDIYDYFKTLNDRLWPRYENGELSINEVRVGRFTHLLDYLGVKNSNLSPEEMNHDFVEGIKKSCVPVENAVKICQILSKHVNLVLVSNSESSIQNQRVKRSGFSEYISHIIISEDTGFQKPQKAFFDYVFKILSESGTFDPKKSIIVGDSLTADILGGKNAGIDTCWFNRYNRINTTEIVPDYKILDLMELETLII